jgi:hypothetical protein
VSHHTDGRASLMLDGDGAAKQLHPLANGTRSSRLAASSAPNERLGARFAALPIPTHFPSDSRETRNPAIHSSYALAASRSGQGLLSPLRLPIPPPGQVLQ